MSDDIYDDGNLDAVQDNEIGPSGPSLMAPDAVALGGPTHHQGADYGDPDTTVTVVDGCQCVHDGVAYFGGETLGVPEAVAAFMVRSGWATAESEPEPDPTPPAKGEGSAPSSPMKARQVSAGGGRRTPKW